MPGFIPVDQMKKLREAAKNGDERAKNILKAQLSRQDYANDLDAYFKPAPQPVSNPVQEGNPGSAVETKATKSTGNPKLDKFLEDNGIHEGDLEYNDAINDYYNEFPNEKPEDWNPDAGEENEIVNDESVDAVKDNFTPPGANQEQNEKMDEAAKDLGKMLIDVITQCDKELLDIMQDDTIDDNAKKGAMTSLQEIKQSVMDSIDKIRKVKNSFKKQENNLP